MASKVTCYYTVDCRGREFYLKNQNSDFTYSFIKYIVQDVTFDSEYVRFKCLKDDKDVVEFCYPAEIFEVHKVWKKKVANGA